MSIPALNLVVVATARIGSAIGLLGFGLPRLFNFLNTSVEGKLLADGSFRVKVNGEGSKKVASFAELSDYTLKKLDSQGSLKGTLARVAFDVLIGAVIGGLIGWAGHSASLIYPDSKLVPLIRAIANLGN